MHCSRGASSTRESNIVTRETIQLESYALRVKQLCSRVSYLEMPYTEGIFIYVCYSLNVPVSYHSCITSLDIYASLNNRNAKSCVYSRRKRIESFAYKGKTAS